MSSDPNTALTYSTDPAILLSRESELQRLRDVEAELESVKGLLKARDAFAKRVERQYSSVKGQRDRLLAALNFIASAELTGNEARRHASLQIAAVEGDGA